MLNEEVVKNLNSNANFDIRVIEKTIEEIKENSFTNLYQFQRDLVSLRVFTFTMADMLYQTNIHKEVRLLPRKHVMAIDGSFIHKRKRLIYKRSKFFNQELSIFDTANNPDIFAYTYLVFVDGKFMDTINILPKEDKTLIIFDIKDDANTTGIPIEYFNELIGKNASISVVFVPNCEYGVYNTDRVTLEKHKEFLSLSHFNIVNSLGDETNYVTFINDNDVYFSSVITDTENSKDMLRFNTVNIDQLFDNKYIHLNIFGFRHLMDQVDLDGRADTFFRLPQKNMPIPVENILIFKRLENGVKVYAHDVRLRLYYPNVYEVLNNPTNDDLTLYVFYSKDNKHAPLKYQNDLWFYQQMINDSVEPYKNNTVPKIVRDYQPPEMIYDHKDYHASKEYPDHTMYKLSKLSGWIDKNPDLMKEYYKNAYIQPDGYYIDVSLIDLQERLRRDNHDEIEFTSYWDEFEEDHYVFILKNETSSSFQDLRFFIDGDAYLPTKKWLYENYEYYYIPARLVEADTVIEIERFKPFDHVKNVTFTNISQTFAVSIPNEVFSRNDIYIIDNATKEFIERTKYDISYMVNGKKVTLEDNTFKTITNGSFQVNILDSALLGKDLQIHVQNGSHIDQIDITEPDAVGNAFIFDEKVYPNLNNFRVFKNGRLLPQSIYTFTSATTYGGESRILLSVLKDIGDTYYVDYTPNSYSIVYEQLNVPQSGFIDLRGKINKPFDLTWYDVYLNGKKLNKSNITYISPYIISLKRVKSLRNFLILEKDKDPDLFFPSKDSETVTDILWETDSEFQDFVEQTQEPIIDEELDVISDIIDKEYIRLKQFFDDVMTKIKFINPDVDQLEPEMMNRYLDIIDPTKPIALNPDDGFAERSFIMYMNPDKKI